MELGLKERTAIVTGAGRGIGAGIARAFTQEGARVLVCDIDGEAVKGVVESLKAEGADAVGMAIDVRSAQDAQRLADTALDQWGRIDVLVNNAGFPRDAYLAKMSEGDWDDVVDVAMKGAFLCTRACIPAMIKAKFGRVINISSRAHLGNPGQASYSAAKAGVIGFTRAVSLESGKFNITVNAVAPGATRTPGLASHPKFEELLERAKATTPIPRIGEVEDIADAVLFLASTKAGYITGDVLHVTGGRYA